MIVTHSKDNSEPLGRKLGSPKIETMHHITKIRVYAYLRRLYSIGNAFNYQYRGVEKVRALQ